MELRHATVLFADLRGFTAVTVSHPPTVVFDALGRWFSRMSGIAAATGGTIASFMGDAVMVIFDDPRSGLACAVDMQIAMEEMNRAHRDAGLPQLFLGIGVHSGQVMAGVLGSQRYAVRTVIGEDVNLAARIEAFGLRGQVLASETTCLLCGGFAQTGEPVEVFVKGRPEGVILREVHGIPSADKRVPRQERRRSPRVPVRMPFTYQLLANDVVSPVRAQGTILDLGYRGVLVELEREHGLFEELKLDVELPLVGYHATDLYGRIVSVGAQGVSRRCGIEFTTLDDEAGRNIRRLVQLLIQGTGSEP